MGLREIKTLTKAKAALTASDTSREKEKEKAGEALQTKRVKRTARSN